MPKRPTTPRLSYADVAQAAENLVRQGLEPGPNAVLRELGRGSLTTIQRHLQTWRGRQTHAVGGPLSVAASDVANLSSLEFVQLVNHLARREALALSRGAVVDTTAAINTPDGGIDGTARWVGGEDPNQFLPARETSWQSKSGNRLRPSQFAAEITSGDGSLRPEIKSLLERGGAYVVYAAADMTPDQKQKAREAMQRVAPAFADRFHVVAGDDIAAWASKDLWARTFLIRAAGRNGPGTLLTFNEWAYRFKNEYVWTDDSRSAAQKLVLSIDDNSRPYRVGGTPGIGKTRFVLEAVRDLPEVGHRVVYYDALPLEDHGELLGAIRGWIRFGVSGVLVVDNCDQMLEQELAAAVTGSMIKAITIAEKRASRVDYEPQAVARDVIQRILEVSGDSPNHRAIHLAIRYAEGWPSIALRVYEAIKNGTDDPNTLTDEVLTERLTRLSGALDELAVLRALSIFDQVGYRDDVKYQWKEVRRLLTPDISERRFSEVASQYEGRGIIRTHGRFWRVGPPPLAIRLMKECLDNADPQSLDDLFQQLPEDMQISIGSRLAELSTPSAIAIVERLLTYDGRFGRADHIFTRAGSRMLASLAEVAPRAACDAIVRAVFETDIDLKTVGEREGRQDLVFALEYIAFHKECFADAAKCLVALARAENAKNSNNATGTLAKFFHIQGSQTEAPPSLRYDVVTHTLSYDDDTTLELTGDLISSMLSDSGTYVRLGLDLQGGRPPLVEWQPQFWTDIFEYWSSAVDFCLALAAKGDAGRAIARKVFANALPALVRRYQWETAERGIRGLRGGSWSLAIERLTWTIKVAMAKDDAANVARANELMDLLQPDSLESMVETRLINPPRELHEDEQGQFRNFAEDKAEQFARETLTDAKTSIVLAMISTGHPQLAVTYGITIAHEASDPESVAMEALEAYRNALVPRNDLALLGIFSVLGERDPALRERLLDTVAADGQLIELLPTISTAPFATVRDIDRLIKAYQSQSMQAPRQLAFMGRRFSKVDPENVRALIEVLIDRGYFVAVFELLTYGVTSSKPFSDLYAHSIVAANILNEELPQAVDYSVMQKTKKLIEGGDVVFATAMTSQLIEYSLSQRPIWERERGSSLWPVVLKHGGEPVWSIFHQRFAGASERERERLLAGLLYFPEGGIGQRFALEELGLENVMRFAQQYPDDVPAFLARYGSTIDVDHQFPPPQGASEVKEAVGLTPLFESLLKAFGDRDDVLANLSAALHGFLSVGPRAPYYARRLKLIEAIPTFGRAKLESWKRTLRADLDAERKRAGLHDDELEGAIF